MNFFEKNGKMFLMFQVDGKGEVKNYMTGKRVKHHSIVVFCLKESKVICVGKKSRPAKLFGQPVC